MHKDWRYIEFLAPIAEAIPLTEGVAASSSKFLIRGTAINSTTTRNGHTFLSEELKLSAPSLIDKPLLKDHENKVDNIVGRTTKAYFDTATGELLFEAFIAEPKYQEMVRNGLIKNVSVGATVKNIEESEDGTSVNLHGIEFLELSLVAIPADPNADFASAILASLDMKKLSTAPSAALTTETAVEETASQSPVEDKIMETTTTETPQVNILEEMKKLMAEQAASLEKKFDEKIAAVQPAAKEKVDETKGVVTQEAPKTDSNIVVERHGSKGVMYFSTFEGTPFKKFQHPGNSLAGKLGGN